jgi:hypothetical protein
MAGTVKLCVPEVVFVGELVACGGGELFGGAEAVAETVESAAAERLCVGEVAGVGDDAGVPVSADVGDPPAGAVGDPPAAADGGRVEGFDPPVPHAVRAAPPMTAAMITAGTRHIPMLLPSGE